MSKKIPHFKSEEEEVRFWDEHSLDEFENELKEVNVECVRDNDVLPVRLDRNDIQHLKNLARKKGLTQGALARMWIKERLVQEKIQNN
ncbi:BrnA antitoxin family protein [Pelotomaculum isophthalicicum JI]|uniref:BrnA antitoxin family protein n=1 Tax=Pelotomaculum isophthalicicum JI TaxID=947010 RepID=A0A9X4JTQ4_9FIRM|nr:CopG family antitoxin [Pelotomaculum isophthalicicum]MDF9407780.1 BrnA antitoxin family protein [Pelotomaculum isophthalicicum JI]